MSSATTTFGRPEWRGHRVLVAIEEPREASRLVSAVATMCPGAAADVVHVAGAATDRDERAVRASVTDAIRDLRARGLDARGLLCHADRGSVAGELASLALASGADLLVMGCGHAGPRARPPAWSVGTLVAAAGEVPLLIVPGADRTASDTARHVTVESRPARDLRAVLGRLLGQPEPPAILVVPRSRPADNRLATAAGAAMARLRAVLAGRRDGGSPR